MFRSWSLGSTGCKAQKIKDKTKLSLHGQALNSIEGKWIFENAVLPEDYTAACRRWMARGVRLIGGCCGIRPGHIQAAERK